MITNGKDIKLNENSGTIPNVSGALLNWFQQITIGIIVKETINFTLVETVQYINFLGIWEQPSPERLEIRASGERSWNYASLWTQPEVNLKTDDIIIRNGVQYRILNKWDWSDGGYLQFDLVQNYTGELEP